MENRLYQILYPNRALVASQLSPEDFGKHYQVGSSKYYPSKLIFSEIDINYRHDYFNIEEVLKNLKPHADGRPKATKYISSYRVLEHIDISAIGNLYVFNPNSTFLELKQEKYEKIHGEGFIRTFANIAPLTMLVLTSYKSDEYAKFTTMPKKSKGSPKLFFTQIELDIDHFLKEFEENPFLTSPIPFVHPSKLRDAIAEVRNADGKKPVKGISLSSDINKIRYSSIRHGFWIASHEKSIFFPMPKRAQIEDINYNFFKAMT